MPISLSPVKMVIHPTSVNSLGMNDVTIENTLLAFHCNEKSLAASLDQPKAKAMKWQNGF